MTDQWAEIMMDHAAGGAPGAWRCEGCGEWTEPDPTLGNGHDNGKFEACGPITWCTQEGADSPDDERRCECCGSLDAKCCDFEDVSGSDSETGYWEATVCRMHGRSI